MKRQVKMKGGQPELEPKIVALGLQQPARQCISIDNYLFVPLPLRMANIPKHLILGKYSQVS